MRRALCASVCVLVCASAQAGMVMPWLCLERCNDTSSDIGNQLAQFSVNSSVLNAAAFEDYNLGEGGVLVKNNLTQVAGKLRGMGVATYAMVSSYPYPPQFLTWMRQVFADPQPFIAACIRAARTEGLTGFNIDWEPVSGDGAPTPTEQDALAYANFLTVYSDALHAAGLQVGVDIATWSLMWNMTAIGASSVDYIFTMQTYTDDWATWLAKLQQAVAQIPASKLVIGVESAKTDGTPYSTAELQQRFAALAQYNVHRVGIWRAPVPDNWWPFLNAL